MYSYTYSLSCSTCCKIKFLHIYYFNFVDVNECVSAATNNCQQICHNTEGSYTCACEHGYTLNADGFTCAPI